ncbi:MAG: sulfotransferase domain-containing protein [Sphingomonas sp.]|uniref:sulfotransferase domain-containing protein n=1 Tax=Sphingomonas sp. TaxID=28214 RepID=UPI003566679C
MSGAIWLASYPRSGNTWTRSALLSLRSDDGAVTFSELSRFGRMATGRGLFDDWLLMDSALLSVAQIEALRPEFHDHHFAASNPPRLCKVHDPWFRAASGRPVFDRAHTTAAIYLVRDPRDVAISWARFTSRTIDAAIAMLADPTAMLGAGRRGGSDHIPQRLGNWSGHVTSWVDDSGLSPLVVRFEDMLANVGTALAGIASHIGWPVDREAIRRATAATRFDRLAAQEQALGFGETPESAERFFVSGKAGGWRDVLTAGQAARVERDHRQVMERLGYL